jgi:hypothetical protein
MSENSIFNIFFMFIVFFTIVIIIANRMKDKIKNKKIKKQ